MTALVWNEVNKRFYETGIEKCVLFPSVGDGVAWSGISSMEEAPIGGNQTPLYYDGVKYLDIISSEDFQATLTAYTSPPEFDICDGVKTLAPGLFASQQPRDTFGLSYKTLIGNGATGVRYAYKLHLIYNATASPTGMTHNTLTDDPEPSTRAWVINTVPPPSDTMKPTAHLWIDSSKVTYPENLVTLESVLYGSEEDEPRLPLPGEVVSILNYVAG